MKSCRHGLIKKFSRQKEAAVNALDEKPAKLGPDGAPPNRAHHNRPVEAKDTAKPAPSDEKGQGAVL